MPPEVEDNRPVLDEDGQKIMAEGLGQVPKPDVLSDDEAQALYKQLYGSAPSADAMTPELMEPEVLPHQSRRYYMNGMEQNNVPQPEVPTEQKFSDEEKQLLSNLGTPSPPETPPQQNQVDLRTQIALLQDMLAAQQAAKTQPASNGQQPQPEVVTPPPVEPEVTPQTPDDAAQKDMVTLDNILQNRFGLRLTDVYQQLAYSNQVANYIGHIQAVQKVETMKDQLKSEWGDQYEYRYEKAREVYKALPDDQKSHIDRLGVRGAELLWAKAAEEESEPNIPTFDRGRTTNRRATSSQDTGVVSKEELLSMSEEEYSREMRPGGRLWNAAVQGKVNYGI